MSTPPYVILCNHLNRPPPPSKNFEFFNLIAQSYSWGEFYENTVRTVLRMTWSSEIALVLPIEASLKPHILQANSLNTFLQCNSSPPPPPL